MLCFLVKHLDFNFWCIVFIYLEISFWCKGQEIFGGNVYIGELYIVFVIGVIVKLVGRVLLINVIIYYYNGINLFVVFVVDMLF